MTQDLNSLIGARLKVLRSEKAWSLDKTSTATGVSKAMLGQIERGESSPTIATLWKIATGLNCTFSMLLGELATEQVFGGEGANPQMLVKTLFNFDPQTGIEVFEITLTDMHEQYSTPHSAGVIEHIHVLQGELAIQIKGEWTRLTTQESFKFNADCEHGYRDLAGVTCFIDVIYYPQDANL